MENNLHKKMFTIEQEQMRYLKLLSMLENMSMSELIREMIDRDIAENEEIVTEYKDLLFKKL